MKRDHQNNLIRAEGGGDLYSTTTCSATATNGKAKMSWEQQTTNPTKEEQHEADALLQDAGEDELLAVLGYKVKSSDMAEVAQKLEQLEMMMGNAQDDNLLLSHLSSDTAHYNPADLSTWLESMLSEVNPVVPQSQSAVSNDPFLAAAESSTITTVDFPRSSLLPQIYDDSTSSDYDLRAIPAGAMVYGERETKRIKHHQETSSVSSSSIGVVSLPPPPPPQQQQSTESTRPVVLMDPQETGIRLVHTLMACAEAVQRENLKLAEALVKQIGLLAVSQAGAMGKVATYFAEALARRIYQFYPQPSLDSSFSDILQMHFYETCPYLKFAHFTANQAILEALANKPRIHIIDFSMKQGMQWPALMQALAIRPGGPPRLRLTGIGPPQPDNTDALQHVGWRLAEFADKLHIEFEFRGFVTNSLADLDASMLDIRGSEIEAVAVNSVFELHQMLALPGAIDKVLGSIKKMKPKIVTIVEQEANHNGPLFLDRFTEALHYYSTLFDSLEGYGGTPTGALNSQDLVMSEMYLGRQICNVVACEGVDRVERHESLTQWRGRLGSAGFAPAHLGSNAFKQAGTLLAALFGGGTGYRVEEHNGCLMLGWHTRPIIASSAWQLRSNSPTRSVDSTSSVVSLLAG